ncbi:MAG: hypothetical protein ACRDRA_12395 [Pseudonocardiaceae bacterium]
MTEVRAVRPDAAPQLAEVLGHPSLVLGELDVAAASEVDQLLLAADVFDGCAGHVVHTARPHRPPTYTAASTRWAAKRDSNSSSSRLPAVSMAARSTSSPQGSGMASVSSATTGVPPVAGGCTPISSNDHSVVSGSGQAHR